jgi:tRNA A-37 threonylcarbamoyl transferase component Bud32/tetratricopeptide (TPR) repeat protein
MKKQNPRKLGVVVPDDSTKETVGDSPPYPEAPSIKGMKIGDYEVISELGRGGMGVVYKARQTSLNRVVAVKMIMGASFASKAQRTRFFREAEMVASLKHPNIVAIHEISEHDGQPFFSMDYIEGTNLKAMIRNGAILWKEAVQIIKAIALAMHTAHMRGVIHRDLKPQNILVDNLRNPHIVDFGLASDINSDLGLTISGVVIGTPHYMSPEQSSGTKEVSPSTDVYSIGAMLYELLTSLPPFRGDALSEVLEKVRTLDPIPPRLINPSIPKDLNTVCLKCLQKVPERRYKTAFELAEDLDRVLSDVPVRARATTRVELVWRWCWKNRGVAATVVSSLFVLVVVVVTSIVLLNVARLHAEAAQRMAEMDDFSLKKAYRELAAEKLVLDDLSTKQQLLIKKDEELLKENGIYHNEIERDQRSNAERDLHDAQKFFASLSLGEALEAVDKLIGRISAHGGPKLDKVLEEAWHLKGQLALCQGHFSEAQDYLNKADSYTPGLDGDGRFLLKLAMRYAPFEKLENGVLDPVQSGNVLKELQGRPEYLAYLAGQGSSRRALLERLKAALIIKNGGSCLDGSQMELSSTKEGLFLEISNVKGDLDLSPLNDFAVFNDLLLENSGITHLVGLEAWPLIKLQIINTPVIDLKPLSGNKRLTDLVLNNTKVDDLSPLSGAPVDRLVLNNQPVLKSSIPANWPLTDLEIYHTKLSPDLTLPSTLQTLTLQNDGLTSIAFLEGKNLTDLDLSSNSDLSDLSPLSSMSTLRSLDISYTAIPTVRPLQDLNLDELILRNSQVHQLIWLRSMHLKNLDIRGCTIVDPETLINKPDNVLQ